MTLDVDTRRFNEVLATVADKLGVTSAGEGSRFVRKQAGLLTQTLIRITPPTRRAQTAQKIEDRVNAKFASLKSPKREFDDQESGGKHGSGSIRWYSWNSTGLYGVARAADFRYATPDQLYELMKRTTSRGTIIAGQRGKQKVRIWQKILTKKKTVNDLVRRLLTHIGRLKAGWCVSWQALGAPTGVYSPPEWVTRHMNGARGYSVDGLGIPGRPTFSMANFAAGATHEGTRRLVQRAILIRSQAMMKDLQLYVRGIKERGKFL